MTEVPLWQAWGYGVHATPSVNGVPSRPWSSSACRAAACARCRPSASVGGERVGAAGRAGRGADRERPALHLEDRQHDPQHRHQQQDAEPAQLDQGAAPLVAAGASRRLLHGVAGHLERDRRAAEPQRGDHGRAP